MTAKYNPQDALSHGIKRPLDHTEQLPKKLLKMSTEEDPTLAAYKRIWNQLDLSNPTDARLESFLWDKIRSFNKRQ
ncbi:hypothetical protein A0J61_02405 [Choanephora cucurbitarum]|uniref:Uncharacterized protein n=1 Tax=Choanephora cucurbitarum TaxID=101091 RepID=A0A1C7NK62_9FUNG|nr:hypothetical protein A0J61_02405 [Choanephora cucurbitarum]